MVEAFFISVPVRALGPVNGPSNPMLIVSVAALVVQPVAPEAAGAEEPAAAVAGACDAGSMFAGAGAGRDDEGDGGDEGDPPLDIPNHEHPPLLATSGGRIACAVGRVALRCQR
jgi:hypothetical protein